MGRVAARKEKGTRRGAAREALPDLKRELVRQQVQVTFDV